MKKTITLEGKELTLESNALLPRHYRRIFGRDMLRDMNRLMRDLRKDLKDLKNVEDPEIREEMLENIDLEVVENVTWLMLKIAKDENGNRINDVKNSPEEWLESLDESMAVYFVMGDVIDLWMQGQKTTSKPKKK